MWPLRRTRDLDSVLVSWAWVRTCSAGVWEPWEGAPPSAAAEITVKRSFEDDQMIDPDASAYALLASTMLLLVQTWVVTATACISSLSRNTP